MKKMIPKGSNFDNRLHLEVPPLEAAIVESILETCVGEASIIELTCATQRLSTHYVTLKKYLFYLIEYDMVAYRGQKGAYVITYNGLSLLFEIKREKTMVKTDSSDIVISLE